MIFSRSSSGSPGGRWSRYEHGSARPSGCGKSDPKSTWSEPIASMSLSSLSSWKGLIEMFRLNATIGSSSKAWGILRWTSSRCSRNGTTQSPPFSTAAILRSGKRVRTPWHTSADMVSSIARLPCVIIRKASGRNGSISCGPVQSLW